MALHRTFGKSAYIACIQLLGKRMIFPLAVGFPFASAGLLLSVTRLLSTPPSTCSQYSSLPKA